MDHPITKTDLDLIKVEARLDGDITVLSKHVEDLNENVKELTQEMKQFRADQGKLQDSINGYKMFALGAAFVVSTLFTLVVTFLKKIPL